MKIVQTPSGARSRGKDTYLEIGSCALCADMDTRIAVENRAGREDYHFIYIVDGTLYFELDGKKMDVGAGNLIIFAPHEAQVYGSHEGDTVSFYHAHFSGSAVPHILEDCGFKTSTRYFIDVDSGICRAIGLIIKEYTYGEYCYITKCNSLFIMLFAEMARLTDHAAKADGKYEVLLPALKAMEQNYDVWYKNEELAAMCGISKYHFIHLFSEYKGCSPSRYKSELLMQKAGELVGISDLSMNEISEMLGFEDPLYFSKKFKTHFGMSPSAYRKKQNEI